MRWNRVQGSCRAVLGRAKQLWGTFNQDEVAMLDGQRQELVGQLQAHYECPFQTACRIANTTCRRA